MAEKVDASGFRTVIRNNPDGSVTMLRTRAGHCTTPDARAQDKRACANRELTWVCCAKDGCWQRGVFRPDAMGSYIRHVR